MQTEARYALSVRLMHWLLAILLVSAFGLGVWLDSLSMFDSQQALAGLWHKSLGLLVGILMIVRWLVWLSQPPLPPVGSLLEQRLAKRVQALLYLLVVAAAVSGYLLATGSGRPLEWFGLVQIPAVVVLDSSALESIREVHGVTVWALAGLTGLHVLAVLKHQIAGRVVVLKRML